MEGTSPIGASSPGCISSAVHKNTHSKSGSWFGDGRDACWGNTCERGRADWLAGRCTSAFCQSHRAPCSSTEYERDGTPVHGIASLVLLGCSRVRTASLMQCNSKHSMWQPCAT